MNSYIKSFRNGSATLPCIFILSCERSGSTLLRYIVDTHPKICCPGQLYLGPLCQSLYATVYFSLGQVRAVSTAQQREKAVINEVRCIVTDLMNRYAQGKGKQLWCDKTTLNLNHLEILNKVFPDARCICLYRHCMDVAYSCIKYNPLGFMPELVPYVRRTPENIVAAMVDSWGEKTGMLLNFERENESRCFRVTYESLVSNPIETLKPMFNFLGVEWHEPLLDTVFSTHHDPGYGDTKAMFSKEITSSSIGKGAILSLTSIPGKSLEGVNALLKELGYQRLDPLTRSELFPEKATEQSPTASRIKHVFKNYFPRIIEKRWDEFRLIGGICKFVVQGDGGGYWLIDPTSSCDQVRPGDGKADCTIVISSGALIAMVDGSKNPIEAYEQGELVITGNNTDLAVRLGKVLLGL